MADRKTASKGAVFAKIKDRIEEKKQLIFEQPLQELANR